MKLSNYAFRDPARGKGKFQAVQLTFENHESVMKWCNGSTWSEPPMRAVTGIIIPGWFDPMIARFGDWVIRTKGSDSRYAFFATEDANFKTLTKEVP